MKGVASFAGVGSFAAGGINQDPPNPSPEAREHRQAETLQRLVDAIVWEWDNPYSDPGDWTPLEDEE
jgi:hypothetical protein